MIELRDTPTMGWGVFATELIHPGKEIARNVADAFTAEEWENIKQGPFAEFVFMDKAAYAGGIHSGFISWGTITKVNHSFHPNAAVKTTQENGHLQAVLFATKRIHKGDQIFIQYTNAKFYSFAA